MATRRRRGGLRIVDDVVHPLIQPAIVPQLLQAALREGVAALAPGLVNRDFLFGLDGELSFMPCHARPGQASFCLHRSLCFSRGRP